MYIDSILLIIIFLCLFFGIKKGLIFEFFSLFGLFVTAMLTKRFVNIIYNLISASDNGPNNFRLIIAYVITFLIIYISMFIILLIVKKFFETILLGWVDKIGGAIFGLIKGVIISLFIALVLIGVSFINASVEEYYIESYTSKIMDRVYPAFLKFLPESFSDKVVNFQEEKEFDNILDSILNENRDKIEKIIMESSNRIDTDRIEKIIKNENLEIDSINEVINKEMLNENIDEIITNIN